MLGYIEKGKRFPSEALVRRLAAVRKQDAHELLALLWRDRILYAFGKELRRVLHAPRAVAGIDDADLAVLVSQAIAALPDDGELDPRAPLAHGVPRPHGRGARANAVADALARQVEETLVQRELVEVRAGKVRRRGRHFVAKNTEERRRWRWNSAPCSPRACSTSWRCPSSDTGTYLRNHYLNIEPARLPEFQQKLDESVRRLAEEFATDASAQTRFLNVLVTSTTF